MVSIITTVIVLPHVVGVDLVDPVHKILYQYKNYKTKLNISNVNTFSRTVTLFKEIDPEYVGKIICDIPTEVSKNISDRFEIIRINFDELIKSYQ